MNDKEEDSMCQALREIMEPELKQSMKEGMEKGMEKGILATVKSLREVGQREEDIKSIIVRNFELLPAEAEDYMIS